MTIVVGGGAAGFFGAIACAQKNPSRRVILLEKTHTLLTKVILSGGGRCNITNACFDPALLVQNYPRGGKALRSAFSRFQPRDMMQWLEEQGVQLKVEKGGRVFPVSDSSQTIVDCLIEQAKKYDVEILTDMNVEDVTHDDNGFTVAIAGKHALRCMNLLVTVGGGSNAYRWLSALGHSIEPPVPSLFTFNIPQSPLLNLSGTAVDDAEVTIVGTTLKQRGAILITHWGFSGPAILKLSSWGARILHDSGYHATIVLRWLPEYNEATAFAKLLDAQKSSPVQTIYSHCPFSLPAKLWQRLVIIAGIEKEMRWSTTPHKKLRLLCELLIAQRFEIAGRTSAKEEFVTCGGVKLSEVDFKTMESRIVPGLYLAGEVLDIDGVTGGFNLQNAWTTAWIAGTALAR